LNNSDEPLRVGDVLFSDLAGRHKLIALSAELTVENLLNRYNVELLRGVLYLAPRLIIRVHDNYKDLFKFIKLFGLMHETRPLYSKSGIEGDESSIEGYEILLEGAVSPFLARTDRRYGIQFARFLPALLLCEADWELEAELVTGFGKNALFKLKPQPHLRSHFKGSGEFDSQLEQSLAISFEEKFGTGKQKERKGWAIQREDRIIPVFDTVMIPDFSFEHTDGRRVLLEIMGFWQPQYLERKIAKLNRAGRRDLIVMVSERTRCGREHFSKDGQEPVYPVIFFKGVPRLGQVMEALERWAI
jgi:predicted nuclease of restriction endonuclease-like RecB superfamily